MSYHQSLGQACPACSFHNGITCIPCSESSDLDECEGCVGGSLPAGEESWWDRSRFWAPMVITVVGAVLSTVAVAYVAGSFNIKE
jgi:hypothetical protein